MADVRKDLNTFIPNQVTSMVYSDIQNKPDSCKISITNLTLEQVEEEVLQEEQPLLVSWGVFGKFQIDKFVIIKEIEWEYGISINATITCRDRKVKLMDRKAAKVWIRFTSSEIVEDIARRMDFGYNGLPTKGIVKVVQGGKSYGKILSDLAELEGYYWTVSNDNKILFLPAYEFNKTRATYNWFVTSDPDIIVAKITTTARRIAPKTSGSKAGKGTTATTTDPATGTTVTETQNAVQTPASSDGKDHSSITFNSDGGFSQKEVKGEIDVHPANEDPIIAKKRAKAIVLRAKWKTSEASLLVENKPLESGDIIDIQGVANLHTGKYKVQSVNTVYTGAKLKIQTKMKKDTSKKKGGKKPETTSPGSSDTGSAEVVETKQLTFNSDGSFTEG